MIFNSLQHFLDQFPSCPFCNKTFDYYYDESTERHCVFCEDCNKYDRTSSSIYIYDYFKTKISVDWIMFRYNSFEYGELYFGYNSYPIDLVTYFEKSIEISTSKQLIKYLNKFKKDVRNNKLLA